MTDKAIEAAAKEICKWIGYEWDGMRDDDISGLFPDWCSSGMQGGKSALMRVARAAIEAYKRASVRTDKAINAAEQSFFKAWASDGHSVTHSFRVAIEVYERVNGRSELRAALKPFADVAAAIMDTDYFKNDHPKRPSLETPISMLVQRLGDPITIEAVFAAKSALAEEDGKCGT